MNYIIICVLGYLVFSEIMYNLLLFPGYWNCIKGYGTVCIQRELEDSSLSDNKNYLHLKGTTILNGSFIMGVPSILFSYVLADSNKPLNYYGIMRFTKSHYLIKNKLKELKNLSPRLSTRLRF